ncbi:hypothetical protein NX801_10020 [Streptomyces sp. LP05-1]|uniref:MarR family transcriptional regulator n=1 Tax=Streptomyces pyxinae TaxID=2970734 RepID=A0ABT2CF08_9ACTN|nr:hypothetical protein [Streptomyces sp. LP05-1]MCS0635995.1 hypothetical protein [Streptomyces sp. LP05-1]
MAESQLSAAAHPLASPGYGKRSAPGQRPRSAADFAELPHREQYIAGYIDRLPDGSDIGHKTLASVLPLYGQQAVSTALNNLVRAGYLRRGREQTDTSGGPRWVTRTWWSRTPRDDAWWAAFQRGDVPDEDRPKRTTLSRAFVLLAALTRETPALTLSSADCTRLAPLVTAWFDRGAEERQVRYALTTGLPPVIHHPFALLHRRLTDKIPPERIRPVRPPLRVLECARCGDPARPEALLDGECGPCRGRPAPPPSARLLSPARVRAHAARARAAATGLPPEPCRT